MRFGGPVSEDCTGPAEWVSAVKALGYSAAYCPVKADCGDEVIAAYVQAAAAAGIVIAEVGAWSNPLSDDEKTRDEALAQCKRQLALAEQVGARCCVNIAGSRGEQWDGPHEENFSAETFERIVATVREIIDAVRPERSFYTLETMPWAPPDSADSYLELVRAVDRKAFAVHFDPVNIVCSPQRFYRNAELIRDFVARLGPHIRSCHAKDIALSGRLTVHLDEVRPGAGGLDYPALLRELDSLDPDTPLMLEHLQGQDEYAKAAEHIRSAAREAGVKII